MIIDSHQHFWSYSSDTHGWINEDMKVLKRDFLPNDLLGLLEKAGVDGTVAVQVDQSLVENDFLLYLMKNHPIIKGVVGWLDLKSANLDKQIEQYKEYAGFKGVRHITQGEPDELFLANNEFIEGVRQIGRKGLTYDLLVYHDQLPVALDFVGKLREQKVVLDHLGKPDIKGCQLQPWKSHIQALAKRDYVYCKLSGMVTEADFSSWTYEDLVPYMETILESFGPERLMIGSDWPVCLLADDYEGVWDSFNKFISSLSMEEQRQIKGQTAMEFYSL